MKTISNEEIQDAAVKDNKLFYIMAAGNQDSIYDFVRGAKWAIEQLQPPQSGEVIALEESARISNVTDAIIKGWLAYTTESVVDISKAYQNAKAKSDQLEKENVRLIDEANSLVIENMNLYDLVKQLIPIAEDGYKLHAKNACHQEFLEEDRELLAKAKQALQSETK